MNLRPDQDRLLEKNPRGKVYMGHGIVAVLIVRGEGLDVIVCNYGRASRTAMARAMHSACAHFASPRAVEVLVRACSLALNLIVNR